MPPADIKVRLKDRRTALALLSFICLIVVVIVGQTWWASTQDRLLSISSEKKHALVAVRGLEEHANQIFDGADRAIDATIKKIQAAGEGILDKPLVLQRILDQEQRSTPYLQSIRYIDLQGVSRITSFAPPAQGVDVSDRQYVQFLNSHPKQVETAIGHPVKSRYDNQWVIPLARNLFDANGHRIGLISAYILVPYFEEFYQRVAKENAAVVALYSDNGFVLLQSPFDEKLAGKDVSNSLPLQYIRKGPIEGTFEKARADGGTQLQLFAYRKISNFPVTSVYARNMDEVLAAWTRRTTDRILFAGAAMGFLLALATLLAIQIHRLQKSADRLSASEDRYKILFDRANDAILLWNLEQVYLDCNEAAVLLFGMPDKHHIIGRNVGDFSPPEQPHRRSMAQTRQHYIDAALKGEVQRFEWATVRNGKLFDSEVTLSRAEINNETLLLAIFHDISARKYAQELQNGQNRILHMIAAGDELDNILTEIALFIQKHAPHICCGIMLLNDAQTHFSYGITPGWAPETSIAGMPVAMGNGCCSETVLSRCPVIIEEFSTSPSVAGLEKWLGPLRFASSGSWPIMGKRGEILGALSVFYPERLTPGAADMQLVGISTDLAGIAIESRKAEEWILHLAHYDELTGLPNRFLFIQHLHKALILAERQQQAVAVLFLDLDRFKNINDTFGHEIGDQVLHDTAARMRLSLREEDTIARVGGDEFLALIENYQDPRQLAEIALRLLAAAATPFEINHHDYQLSVSIGIATYPGDGVDTQTLLKNADIAMYRAKTTGKNNYQFYSAEMNTHSVERALLEARLRKAIEQREFVVHYQPKINARTGHLIGAEALVRWQHPERGLIYPGEFIALAEEAGQIGALGKLVLDITCHDIAELDQQKLSFGRIAINLSAVQFNQPGLLEQIGNAVTSHGISPSSLEFEITESMVMHSREQAIGLMNSIRALGCTLSIDDFGTGYSSLAYLKRFPVNNLKIDKSFINDITSSANDSAIVQAIIVMAHTLGLEVIAEGVETQTQLQMLRRFGCDTCQGFYFSRAVPAREFTAMIEREVQEVT